MKTRILFTGTRLPASLPEAAAITHAPMLKTELIDLERSDFWREAARASSYELVFYSVNGVRSVLQHTPTQQPPLPARVWCVGDATAALAREHFQHVVVAPPNNQTFEGLAAQMCSQPDLAQTILVAGLEGKQRPLAERLSKRPEGVSVLDYAAYRTIQSGDGAALIHGLEAGQDWIVFTSPRGVRAAARLLAHHAGPWSLVSDLGARIASIGPTTAAALESIGARVDKIAEAPDTGALIEALCAGAPRGD